jgi:hypothetical protein
MRISFLSSIPWRWIEGLTILTLLVGTMLAQAVPVATLKDAPLNFGPVDSVTGSPASTLFDTALFDTAGSSAGAPSPVAASALPEAPSHHKFWDTENRALFAMVVALSAADFAVTRAILQNGGKELNPVTRLFSGSTAGLAANFAGETAGIIGLSYYLHKTGHHQLERITPMLNIGASSFAVAYDLNHR